MAAECKGKSHDIMIASRSFEKCMVFRYLGAIVAYESAFMKKIPIVCSPMLYKRLKFKTLSYNLAAYSKRGTQPEGI
jgi:hypothetical protein